VQFLESEIMQSKCKIGFIGGGNMAGALISGLVDKLDDPQQIYVVDLNMTSLDTLAARFGVKTATQIDQRCAALDVIIFAVKPHQMHTVLENLVPFLSSQLLISVAAGIRAGDISRWLGGYSKIVRAMPNTPAMIGLGMSGLFALDGVNVEQKTMAESMLRGVGETVWVDQEHLIDAVTAVSGSGPAYVFYFIEAMQEAAVALGLNQQQATQLALATFNGAAQLAKQSDETVQVLRERVTSKGGTTYAALCSMDESKVKLAIHKAINAAAQRGKAMGDEYGQA
jgi:pyrroline-5-carboxylate reductase